MSAQKVGIFKQSARRRSIIINKRRNLGVMGVSMHRGENSKSKSGEHKEAEQDKKRNVFEGARTIIIGDLDEL